MGTDRNEILRARRQRALVITGWWAASVGVVLAVGWFVTGHVQRGIYFFVFLGIVAAWVLAIHQGRWRWPSTIALCTLSAWLLAFEPIGDSLDRLTSSLKQWNDDAGGPLWLSELLVGDAVLAMILYCTVISALVGWMARKIDIALASQVAALSLVLGFIDEAWAKYAAVIGWHMWTFGVLAWHAAKARPLKVPAHICAACGYDLRGLPRDATACPECGASTAPVSAPASP